MHKIEKCLFNFLIIFIFLPFCISAQTPQEIDQKFTDNLENFKKQPIKMTYETEIWIFYQESDIKEKTSDGKAIIDDKHQVSKVNGQVRSTGLTVDYNFSEEYKMPYSTTKDQVTIIRQGDNMLIEKTSPKKMIEHRNGKETKLLFIDKNEKTGKEVKTGSTIPKPAGGYLTVAPTECLSLPMKIAESKNNPEIKKESDEIVSIHIHKETNDKKFDRVLSLNGKYGFLKSDIGKFNDKLIETREFSDEKMFNGFMLPGNYVSKKFKKDGIPDIFCFVKNVKYEMPSKEEIEQLNNFSFPPDTIIEETKKSAAEIEIKSAINKAKAK